MKTINRNNYEEYFLLYADNELDAAAKLAVENFIEQNTDLAIELEMLLSTKYAPEQIVFNDKDLLLRTEGNSINEKNYEEYFLLYIDNELSAAKREEVERYVLQHPKLQNEFTGLKAAVLAPKVISYGDKKDLYRAEKKRTVYMRPWLAAAAIFIGVCATGWWLLQKPEKNITVSIHPLIKNKTEQNSIIKPADTIEQQTMNNPAVVVQQSLTPAQNKTPAEKTIALKKDKELKNKAPEIVRQHLPPQQENIIHKNVAADIIEQHKNPVIEKNDVAMQTVPSNLNENVTAAPLQINDNTETNNGYKMYDVAYKEINTNDDGNSLHVGGFDLNKNKVKNLFKKAGRLFGNKVNNTASDDGKLQVANFEIQTNKQ